MLPLFCLVPRLWILSNPPPRAVLCSYRSCLPTKPGRCPMFIPASWFILQLSCFQWLQVIWTITVEWLPVLPRWMLVNTEPSEESRKLGDYLSDPQWRECCISHGFFPPTHPEVKSFLVTFDPFQNAPQKKKMQWTHGQQRQQQTLTITNHRRSYLMLTVCSWRQIQFSYHPTHLNEATVVFGYLSTAYTSHIYRKSFSIKKELRDTILQRALKIW